MKRTFLILFLFSSFFFLQSAPTGQFERFIKAKHDKLMDGEKEFRFVSINLPNLLCIEDYFPFEASSPWRLPTKYEVSDALKAIKLLGGRVTRMYVPSVVRPGESKEIVRYVVGPGQFSEKAFRALDMVLQVANEQGIRVIIPLVDNWWWWGGPAEYAAFRGKQAKDFWTDPQLIADYKKTVKFILTRKNTLTGIAYKDDKAILGWETGNELDAPLAWQDEIAAYMRSLDKNHLIIEGVRSSRVTEEAVSDTNFDVLTTHFYNPPAEAISDIQFNKKLTKGKKPYFVGEFGFPAVKDIKAIIDSAIKSEASGIMIWSMRAHSRDGGFYQHGEAFAGAYRFPGFPSGESYHEKEVMTFMRERAYAINGEQPPPLPKPEKPELLPINNVYNINWLGAAGTAAYTIERRTNKNDTWQVIANDVSDANVVFRPLFVDTNAELGKSYYYRITGFNEAGSSQPSNVIGPVKVTYKKIIDELADRSLIYKSSGVLEFIVNKDAAKAKGDNSRVKGSKDAFIIYEVPAGIDSVKVQFFFVNGQNGLDISVADSSMNFKPIGAKLETFPPYINYYNAFTPVVYTCAEFPQNSRYLKIKFNDDAQLSRVEIIHSTLAVPDPDRVEVQ